MIADSSTVAMPSTTSPSPGMISPGLDDDPVADRQRRCRAPRSSAPSCASRRATVVASWSGAGVSACALPRPSATASARLANSTVNHSQTAISQAKTLGSTIAETGDEHRADPDDEHDRVAQLRARVELAQRVGQRAPQLAGGERAGADGAPGPFGVPVLAVAIDRSVGAVVMSSASAIGPERQAGKKVRAATRTIVPPTRTPNSGAGGWAGCPRRARHRLLRGERPGQREHGQDRHEPAEQHRQRRAWSGRTALVTVSPANALPLLFAAEA